jgi:hypothetical protein
LSAAVVFDEPAAQVSRGRDVRALLPIAARERGMAALWGRLGSMALLLGVGSSMMLTAWWGTHRAGLAPPALVPVGFWALGAVPVFAFGALLRVLGGEARRRFPGLVSGLWLAACMAVAFGAAGSMAWHAPPTWQLAVGSIVGAAVFGAAVGYYLYTPWGERVLSWLDNVPSSYEHLVSGDVDAAGVAMEPEEGVAARALRRWWSVELGWAFAPELGTAMWARSAAVIFAAFSAFGLVCAIGGPVLVRLTHALKTMTGSGASAGIASSDLAMGPFTCFYCLSVAGIALSAGMWWADYPTRPVRLASGLTPIAAQALWRRRLVAALIYCLGFFVLGQLLSIIGELLAEAVGGRFPLIPLDCHWVALGMPALALIAWAQGPLLRNPLRLNAWPAELWVILTAVVACVQPPWLPAMCESGDVHVWPAIVWPVALVLVALSRRAAQPNAWPVTENGRLTPIGQLAAGGVLIVSFVTSGFLISSMIFGVMWLLPG